MGRKPVLSVVLPCRNAARDLPACIRSVEAQTLREFEVVAVDDGSSDGTRELLEEWAARDGRVRVRASGGRGLVAALRTACEAARAPLIARMDADDVALPHRFARQVSFLLERRALAACGTSVEIFPRPRARSGYRRYERWINSLQDAADLRRDLFVECPIAHPTLVIRASVFRSLGGYRECGWPEDYDLLLRLHAAGLRAANVPEVLLRWRIRSDRHSLADATYSPAAFLRCKVHYLRHHFLPAERPLVVWGAGRVGKSLARELRRQGVPLDAFVDLDPRKIGQEIHGAPVLDPPGFRQRLLPRHPYVLAAVGSPGARSEIRRTLGEMGCREEDDYRACA